MRGKTRGWQVGVLALVLASSLAGCSSLAGIGGSSYGAAAVRAGDVADASTSDAAGALRQAKAHFRSNDFGISAQYYQQVVALDRQNVQGYIGLGASYDRLGRFDLADKVYAALYAISGETAQYDNNLGYSHMLRGDLTGALGYFRKAKALDPANVVVANNILLLSNAAAAGRA